MVPAGTPCWPGTAPAGAPCWPWGAVPVPV